MFTWAISQWQFMRLPGQFSVTFNRMIMLPKRKTGWATQTKILLFYWEMRGRRCVGKTSDPLAMFRWVNGACGEIDEGNIRKHWPLIIVRMNAHSTLSGYFVLWRTVKSWQILDLTLEVLEGLHPTIITAFIASFIVVHPSKIVRMSSSVRS